MISIFQRSHTWKQTLQLRNKLVSGDRLFHRDVVSFFHLFRGGILRLDLSSICFIRSFYIVLFQTYFPRQLTLKLVWMKCRGQGRPVFFDISLGIFFASNFISLAALLSSFVTVPRGNGRVKETIRVPEIILKLFYNYFKADR